jgi:hypothetical protein
MSPVHAALRREWWRRNAQRGPVIDFFENEGLLLPRLSRVHRDLAELLFVSLDELPQRHRHRLAFV